MSLSDRIAVMNQGRIEQVGVPAEIYEAPRTSFVAAFIGDTNFFEGQVTEFCGGDYLRLSIDGLPDLLCFKDKPLQGGNLVYLSIRPEKFHISRDRPLLDDRHNCLQGKVIDVIYLGTHTRYWVRINNHRLAVIQQHSRFLLDEKPIRWEEDVWVSWHADDGFMLERYSESDETLIGLPPEKTGQAIDSARDDVKLGS